MCAAFSHTLHMPRWRWGAPHSKQFIASRQNYASSRINAIIGIDLGTTNSALAYVGPEGPQVIRDADGNATIPSVLIIRESGELLVGWAAAQAVSSTGPADNTFTSFKRLLGHRYSDISLSIASQLPYHVMEGDRGELVIYSAGADGMVTPMELSSWLLQHLLSIAQNQLRESISGAVVTVPAHFDRAQRGATLEAAKQAGISTVHLLQEPVAAALAYGIDGGTDGETVLVFDVGGGTFDVSILQAFEGIMQVLGTAGDSQLGGDDFDSLLADWILRELGLRVEEEREKIVREWAIDAARVAKEALSSSSSVNIRIPEEVLRAAGVEEIGPPAAASRIVELTQETFEIVTAELFHRMADVLENLGKEVFVEWAVSPNSAVPSSSKVPSESSSQNSSKDKNSFTAAPVVDKWAPPPRRISRVALVGQITRLPSVRRFVEDFTGVKPCCSVDPGAAVALGAATQAGILLGSVGSVELMDGSFVQDLHSRVTGFSDWEP